MSIDFHPTPSWCVRRLLESGLLAPYLEPDCHWLEPAVGDGAIVRAVNGWADARGRGRPSWTTVDIRPSTGADIIGDFCGFGRPLVDAARPRRGWSVCLTNPPFSQAMEFVVEGHIRAPVVWMLLPLRWLASASRHGWLRGHMPDVFVLPNRPSFDGLGSDNSDYAWMGWDRTSPSHWPPSVGLVQVLATTSLEERKAR